jgi:hypothetical protein
MSNNTVTYLALEPIQWQERMQRILARIYLYHVTQSPIPPRDLEP